jgi:hypothetical protein
MNNVMINLEEEYCRKYFNKDVVTIDELLDKLVELDDELYEQKEKYRELEEDLRDNYKPYTNEELYGISDRDFL